MDRTLASLSAGKEECSPFLDDLITALFVDLRQHRKFCEVERRLKRAVGRDESEGGAGTDDGRLRAFYFSFLFFFFFILTSCDVEESYKI